MLFIVSGFKRLIHKLCLKSIVQLSKKFKLPELRMECERQLSFEKKVNKKSSFFSNPF